MAGAIVLETLAFVVWNIGTRSPLAVVRDVRRAFRNRRGIVAGAIAAVVGATFIAAATVLLVPAVADPPADFAPTQLFTLLVALALEHLVGNDLRALAGTRSGAEL